MTVLSPTTQNDKKVRPPVREVRGHQVRATRGHLDGLNGDTISDPQLFSDLYHNNASRSDGPDGKRCRDLEAVRVDGVYDYMMFMGELATAPTVSFKRTFTLVKVRVTPPPRPSRRSQLGRRSVCRTGCTTCWRRAGSW